MDETDSCGHTNANNKLIEPLLDTVSVEKETIEDKKYPTRVNSNVSCSKETAPEIIYENVSIINPSDKSRSTMPKQKNNTLPPQFSRTKQPERTHSKKKVVLRSDSKDLVKKSNGWQSHVTDDGEVYYAHPNSTETWLTADSSDGKTYFYQSDSQKSTWILPDVSVNDTPASAPPIQSDSLPPIHQQFTPTVTSSFSNLKTIATIDLNTAQAKFGNRPSIVRHASNNQRDNKLRQSVDAGNKAENSNRRYSMHVTGPIEHKIIRSERRGSVNRFKYSVNDAVLSSKWVPCILEISGPNLRMYKEQKNQKQCNTLGKQEMDIELKNVTIEKPDQSQTSKENVFVLNDNTNPDCLVRYLIEVQSPVLLKGWETAFQYSYDWLKQDKFHRTAYATRPPPNVDSKIIVMLRDFFRKRVSVDVLRAKGILQDEPVFGANLTDLCRREESKIPSFMVRAIRAIEMRGITADGLYRKSGNISIIQKLRSDVNRQNYILNSNQLGIYELSDSLKMFLRDLKEPLFCYTIFDSLVEFCNTFKNYSESENVDRIINLFKLLPECHYQTIKFLFHHLSKVAAESSENQMTSRNLSMVFGPNVMWPKETVLGLGEYASAGFFCVDFIITQAVAIFGPIETEN